MITRISSCEENSFFYVIASEPRQTRERGNLFSKQTGLLRHFEKSDFSSFLAMTVITDNYQDPIVSCNELKKLITSESI